MHRNDFRRHFSNFQTSTGLIARQLALGPQELSFACRAISLSQSTSFLILLLTVVFLVPGLCSQIPNYCMLTPTYLRNSLDDLH